jgi:hypothetical protein
MAVYEDFFQYSSGVYAPNKASGLAGYMQARLIGYGATADAAAIDYWIAATVRLPLLPTLALLVSLSCITHAPDVGGLG